MSMPRSLSTVFMAILRRDLLLAFRRRHDLANPLVFFVIAVSLFPLGVSPEKSFLAEAGAGIVWVAALLATLLSLDGLFRSDFEDGSLEQLVLSPSPLYAIVLRSEERKSELQSRPHLVCRLLLEKKKKKQTNQT